MEKFERLESLAARAVPLFLASFLPVRIPDELLKRECSALPNGLQ